MPDFELRVNHARTPLTIAGDETVLAALERQGYRMRVSCRNGVCEICEAKLLQGELQQRYPQAHLHQDANSVRSEQECPDFLVCTATACSDLRISIKGLKRPGEMTLKKLCCEIAQVELLNEDVYRIVLRLPATGTQAVEYKAGQYLDLFLPDGKQASFSIASAPEAGRELELHVRYNPDSDLSHEMVKYLTVQPSIEVELPKGKVAVDLENLAADAPLIMAAASTGFSQIKSLTEHLLAQGVQNPIHIYWGCRKADDLYLDAMAAEWAEKYPNVHYTPVVSEPETSPNWQGATGLLPEAVMKDFTDMGKVQAFASGSPGMVYALLDALEEKGFHESQMHSDVFAYAPRPAK